MELPFFFVIVVLVFSLVVFIISQREQYKTKKAMDEAVQWKQKAEAAQNAIDNFSKNPLNADEGNENAELVKICADLIDSLTFDVNEWEETRKTPNKGSTTKNTQKRWDERNYYYKKLSQKLNEYNEAIRLEKPREQIQGSPENIDRTPQKQ